MEKEFIDILQKLITRHGKEPLLDPSKCKAFLSDYAKREYKHEADIIIQAVNAGVTNTINEAKEKNLRSCVKLQYGIVQNQLNINTTQAKDVVNVLAFVLRGAALPQEKSAPLATPKHVPAVPKPRPAAPPKKHPHTAPPVFKNIKYWFGDRFDDLKNWVADHSSGRGTAIFAIVDRDSGEGSTTLFGIIMGAIGLSIGTMIGGIIAVGLGGIIGWVIGSGLIGKSIYVNLFQIILGIACGILIAFLAGWTGNGLRPDSAPVIARILFIPFMIAGTVLFLIARSNGNKILLFALIVLSIGGGFALTEPPFPFSVTQSKSTAEQTDDAASSETIATVLSGVNFRSAPSISGDIIKILKEGDALIVTGDTESNWIPVKHENDYGYVSAEYIKIEEPE